MEYDVYHDESQEGGYWHGILLLPRVSRAKFLEWLELIRTETQYKYPITFKKLNNFGRKFHCINTWLQLGVGALMQYFKNEPYCIRIEKKEYSTEERRLFTRYRQLININSNKKIIGAKFILFKERDFHSKMGDMYPDAASKIETTFRMGIKGGINWLGDYDDPIYLKSIHFDGHEHYKRNIDKDRIIGRICGLRDYCSLDDNIWDNVDDRTAKHDKDNSQDYDDCQFLQLTDLLIGSFRTVLGPCRNKVQAQVAYPVKQLIETWQREYAGLKNSRWFKGFSLTECWIENNKWNFDNFRFKKNNQAKLF